jgi:general stress protein CsbA
MKLHKIITMLKVILLALLLGLFVTGEYFKKHGGHPFWYWIIFVSVIALGVSLLTAGFLINKKLKK